MIMHIFENDNAHFFHNLSFIACYNTYTYRMKEMDGNVVD